MFSLGMKLARAAKAFAAAAILTAAASSANAATLSPFSYYPTYAVTSPYNIDSLVITGHGDTNDGSYIINSFSTSPGTTVIQDPFPENYLPLYSSLIGVTDLIPGAVNTFATSLAEPSLHLVLAVNNSFAASLINQEFTTIFPEYTEAGLIDALRTLSSGDATKEAKDAAVTSLFLFSDELYDRGANFNVTLSEGFSLVAFSQGQAAGTGQSSIVPIASAVPEPATWAMMIGGLAMIGGTLRRRQNGRDMRLACS